jgi:putative CocE/NonD family hydrolase
VTTTPTTSAPNRVVDYHRLALAVLLAVLGVAANSSSLGAHPPQAGEYSKPQFRVVEQRDVKVAMRDGVELSVDLFRPEAEGKFPVILLQTPYNKQNFPPRAKWFAERGYVVANSDHRGRYASGGEWDPFDPRHKTDGHDLVQWLAGQPWSSGRVGTYGLSYMGWAQWWTATTAPPALKAIVPEVSPPDQFYNAPYQHGVLTGWMMDWASMNSRRTDRPAGPGPYGGYPPMREADFMRQPYIDILERRGIQTAWFGTWMRQNLSTGDYWRAISYQGPENYAKVQVPSLAISGWFDANFPGTPMNYLGMKQHGGTELARRPRMVIGPWEHIINRDRALLGVDFGDQAIIDWDGYVCRWFDFHLKQIDNGVMDDSPVYVFVLGPNRWRAAADWPLPQTKWTRFYFHSGGKANTLGGDGTLSADAPKDEPPDRYDYDPKNPTPAAPFANGHIDGPRDTGEGPSRPDVLVYTTPPLEQDLELVGPVTAHLFAATSARDTDWMVRLCDVAPDGKAAFLCDGVLRARCRDEERGGAFNPEKLSTIEPNRAYTYTVEFWRPIGNVFAKGHRIRIEVSSSFYPYYLRNLNTGADNIALETAEPVVAQQTIYHDAERPSHVVLPVIPAE